MPDTFDVTELFVSVFSPQKGERVLLVTDLPHGTITDNSEWSTRRRMALEWQRALFQASKKLGIRVEALSYYKATGQPNGPLPENIRREGRTYPLIEQLEATDIILALTEYSATAPLTALARESGHLRGASMPGVSKRMEQTALAADYKVVAHKAHVLAERLGQAETAIIEFSTGHTLYVDLRYRHPKQDSGHCPPGADPPIINLPSGEAYIAPYEGERPDEPSRTRGTIPVSQRGELILLEVEGNRIARTIGDGPQAALLRAFFDVDSARRNIAELGLGCNDKAVVTGNVLEDEKAGLHWAYGRSEHLGGVTGPDAFSHPSHVAHEDVVYAADSPIGVKSLRLEFPEGSSDEIMRDSRYTIF